MAVVTNIAHDDPALPYDPATFQETSYDLALDGEMERAGAVAARASTLGAIKYLY